MNNSTANASIFPDVAIGCKNVPPELSFLTFSLSIVFFFVVVSGNSLVMLAIWKDPYHELRKMPFILLVGNLACADLIVGLMVTPISVVLHFMEGIGTLPSVNVSWIKLLHVSYFISCTASLLSMAAITIDRHIAIIYPLRYKSSTISQRPKTIFILIWTFAIALPLVYLKVGYTRYAFVFGNIAICVTMCFLISCTYILRKIAGNSNPAGMRCTRGSERNSRTEKRITKVFSLVLVAYLLCYFPSSLFIYVMNFCSSCSCEVIHWLRDMQFILVLLNSCLNPILYAWQMKVFQSAFKSLLCCSFERVNLSSHPPSSALSDPCVLKREVITFPEQKSCHNLENPSVNIAPNELHSLSKRPTTNKNKVLSFEQKIDIQ